MSDPIRAAFASIIAVEVRAAVRAAMVELEPALVAAVRAAPNRKQRLTLSEARSQLAGGCRTQRMLSALASGALRGEQREDGRRTWVVDCDDVSRWDAAGRPVKPAAIARQASANKTKKHGNKLINRPIPGGGLQQPCNTEASTTELQDSDVEAWVRSDRPVTQGRL